MNILNTSKRNKVFLLSIAIITLSLPRLTVNVDAAIGSIPPLAWTSGFQGTSGSFGQVNAISCPTKTFCAAGGTSANESALITTYSAGAWSLATMTLPVNADSASEITGLSCASASSCIAVGNYATNSAPMPFTEFWNGSSWSLSTSLPGIDTSSGAQLNAVSCPSTSFCVAVGKLGTAGSAVTGTFEATFNGSSWSAVQLTNDFTDGSFANLLSITCSSVTFCIAGGWVGSSQRPSQQALLEVWDGATWTPSIIAAEINPGKRGSVTTVSCSSSTNCVAGGSVFADFSNSYAFASSWDGTSWTTNLINTFDGNASTGTVTSSSCVDQHMCVLVGNADNFGPFDIRINSSQWITELRGALIPDGAATQLRSVACPSVNLCIAVGGLSSRYIATFDGSSWSDSVSAAVYYQPLRAITCYTVELCVAGGTYATSSYQRRPMTLVGKPPTSPSPPSSVAVVPGKQSLTASWSASNDGGLSPVTYTASDSSGHSCSTAGLTCTITGLTPGQLIGISVAASNLVGVSSSSTTASATPYDIPSAPQDVAAQTIGSSRVSGFTISWSTPASNGYSPITGYEVSSQPSFYFVCRPVANSCSVFGTNPGTSYVFSVVAVNAAGRSASASVTAVSKGVPSVPQSLVITPSVGSASVSWKAPSQSNGSPVTGYRVTVIGDHRTFTTSATKLQIQGLSSSALNQVSVAAINAIGYSGEATSDSFFAWSGVNSSPGVLLNPSVAVPRQQVSMIIAAQIPSLSLSVAWTGNPQGGCYTNNAGQCTMQITPPRSGIYPIVISGSKFKTLTTKLYVPSLDGPAQIKHGGTATFKVSNCPPGSAITLTASDGRKFHTKATSIGSTSIYIATSKQGALTLQLSVGTSANLISKSIVIF